MVKKLTISTQQGLDRALELLETLAKTGGALNVAEISKSLGITRTTTSSMLQSLMQRNYIEKDPDTGKYSIGYKLYEMALAYGHKYPFLYAAEEHISSMAEKLKTKINVCVLKPPGVAVVILSKDISLLPKMSYGHVLPCYASASGKLLMAYAPRETLERWLDETGLVSYTPNTIIDKSVLFPQLDQIKSQGIACEFEELMIQRCCIAAPIRNISGQVIASVSFSTTREFVEANLPMLTENITLLGKSISSKLGYNPIMFR